MQMLANLMELYYIILVTEWLPLLKLDRLIVGNCFCLPR